VEERVVELQDSLYEQDGDQELENSGVRDQQIQEYLDIDKGK